MMAPQPQAHKVIHARNVVELITPKPSPGFPQAGTEQEPYLVQVTTVKTWCDSPATIGRTNLRLGISSVGEGLQGR